MSAGARLAAVNSFLDVAYGPGTRLSTLLAAQGCTPQELMLLRERHLEPLVGAFVAGIADRLAEYRAGERKYYVLARRFGLDGEPRGTLAAIGAHMGLTGERVRQIEDSALRHCRSAKNRLRWQEGLYQAATALLAGGDRPVTMPAAGVVTPAVAPSAPATPTEASPQPELDPRVDAASTTPAADIDEERLQRLPALVEAILRATGDKVRNYLIAHILRNSPGPVTEAMIGYYRLEFACGIFADVDIHALIELVRQARLILGIAPDVPGAESVEDTPSTTF